MKPYLLLVLFALILLGGCSGYQPPKFDPAIYTSNYKAYDLDFHWKATKEPAIVIVDGFVKNNTHYYLSDLELTITALDLNGRSVGEKTYFVLPSLIQIDETVPFELKIATSQPAHRLKFYYKYLRRDGKSDSYSYFYSFEAGL